MNQKKVDDLVTIRSWDDMMAEFGPDKDGDISCPWCFVQDMKDYCGETLRVMEVYPVEVIDQCCYILDGAVSETGRPWFFGDEMFLKK